MRTFTTVEAIWEVQNETKNANDAMEWLLNRYRCQMDNCVDGMYERYAKPLLDHTKWSREDCVAIVHFTLFELVKEFDLTRLPKEAPNGIATQLLSKKLGLVMKFDLKNFFVEQCGIPGVTKYYIDAAVAIYNSGNDFRDKKCDEACRKLVGDGTVEKLRYFY